MKTELIDIQSALNKCKSSLCYVGSPTSSSNASHSFLTFMKTSSPQQEPFSSSNMSCSTPKKSAPHTPRICSSSLNEKSDLLSEEDYQNESQSLSSSTILDDLTTEAEEQETSQVYDSCSESSDGYPSMSLCHTRHFRQLR